MKFVSKAYEKWCKLLQYIKLKKMFFFPNEFKRKHPELASLWEKKFRQMIRYSSDRTFPIVEEFLNVRIDKVSDGKLSINNAHKPVLVCALKNDIDKIPYFMKHYRRLGIENFVFLDNMSTDGTFEFLVEQKDVIVYKCEHSFTADRKIAWINRLIAETGIDRWYLMVDSDEFVTYLGYSQHNIEEFIAQNESKGFKRAGSVMLDTYPREDLFAISSNTDFLKKYCYIDKDTYTFSKAANGMKITGGPRNRVFGTRMKLSKYCLFFFEEEDIIPSAHFLIPFEKSFDVPVSIAILHYKFVNESDYKKVIEAVETEMHSDNSAEYKTYLKGISEKPKLTFYDEDHSMPLSEENLKKISFIIDIFNL